MKKFQPLNATEHLQALYAAGEDWAQEALEAVEAQTRARDANDLAIDLASLLGFDLPDDLWDIHRKVESLMRKLDELKEARLLTLNR